MRTNDSATFVAAPSEAYITIPDGREYRLDEGSDGLDYLHVEAEQPNKAYTKMVKKGLPTNALGKKIVDKKTIKEFHDVVGRWKKDIFEGVAAEMGLVLVGELPLCEGCIQAESKRQKFRKIVNDPPKEPLEIHVDTSGLFS